ncbi:unnamed protein product [Phytophthora fragariaefolia]|uniref:Unnamed protein product n=1 Tax=Phytophthora fragariaefolia TaxID=1490495 RepID=A0A9W7CVK0_9STRA|nr:unnamed protein product [Phytophthora fragariaefolia]
MGLLRLGARNRVHSWGAKGVEQSAAFSGDSNQVNEVKGKAAPESDTHSNSDTSLPKLQPQVVNVAPTANRDKSRFTGLHRKPTPPLSNVSASGTDATSQVPWAVKVTSPAPAEHTLTPPELPELKDLQRLLRDRYGEKRSVRQAFLTWDTNKDGHLCIDELQNMLTRLGFAESLGGEKVDAILQHVLKMPAASLNYDDFCGLVYGSSELNESCSNSRSVKREANYSAIEEDMVPVSDPDCVLSLLRAKYETRRVHQVFRNWDIDKSGGVTLAEIESNLRRQGLRIAKPQLMKLFDAYDLNHDGRLLYDEFMRLIYGPVHEKRYSYLAAQRKKKHQEQQMDAGDPLSFFRSLTAASQQIDFSTDLGINLTEREFLHLATRVDTDGNGEISFKEFCDVFGGGEGFNRRRNCTTPSGGDIRERAEERESKLQAKNSNQQQRAAGTFDFSHLTSGIQNDNAAARYKTETQLYGSGSSSRSAPTPSATLTLGQEEKQRRDAANAQRLQRLRLQMELHQSQAKPLQETYTHAQERRVQTLRRHQERYRQSIEEQRPRVALSPARKGINIPPATTLETH